MEIKIIITKQNKDKVLKLLDQLVESEAEAVVAESGKKVTVTTEISSAPNVFQQLATLENVAFAEPEIKKSAFGSWGMFNSYVPGKVALRLLCVLINRQTEGPISLSSLVDECLIYFSKTGLSKYRGFPKKATDSARARLAIHLMLPYHEMGLIRIFGDKKNPNVMITQDGYNFAKLRNPLLDDRNKTQALSKEESAFLIAHLKKIDGLGYKEFSILKDLTDFFAGAERHYENAVGWFKSNQAFVESLRSGSRYKNDPAAFLRQLENVARMFASGKIALLRELNILDSSRASYHVLRDFEA